MVLYLKYLPEVFYPSAFLLPFYATAQWVRADPRRSREANGYTKRLFL